MANQHTKKADQKARRNRSRKKPQGTDGDGFIRNNEEGRRILGEKVAEALTNALPRMITGVIHVPTPLMNKADEKAKTMPHFTLLATDNFTPVLVEKWIGLAVEMGVPEEKLLEAKAILRNIQNFRTANPLRCKKPD